MLNSGGYAVTRTHSGDRFYNPPAMRRNQVFLQQQQQQLQLQRLLQKETQVDLAEVETRTDSEEPTLFRPNSVCSTSLASSPRNADLTNLDRLVDSVTPCVQAQYLPEARMRGCRTHEADIHCFFSLEDLWESFNEWSVYGVEVPLLLNGSNSVKQYYVPSLSGIQLYIDPHRLRRPAEDSDAESSRGTSSAGSSDCEAERQPTGVADGMWSQHNNLSFQRLNRLTLGDKAPLSSSNDETEVCNSPGSLVFEYLEQEQPHHRQPLYDKVLSLASQNPEIRMYRSCDLLPVSWVSVAWYPIYRIPVGHTLQNLDASFLTFYSLSTHARGASYSLSSESVKICHSSVSHGFGFSFDNGTGKNQPQFSTSSGRKVYGVDGSSKIPLPVFGLASYKLRGSILTPNEASEMQQANSLLHAADNWLRHLQVNLPDFQFFVSHNSQWRWYS